MTKDKNTTEPPISLKRLTLYEGGDKDAQPLLTTQKQIRRTTIQIWHTAPLLYSVCYRL